jgi:hypothetical protein
MSPDEPADAELEKAALNVQKVFRGMKVRKSATLASPAKSTVNDQVLKTILETTGADLHEGHEKTKCSLIGFVDSASGFAIMLNAAHIGGQANCVIGKSCYMSAEMMNTVDLVFALGFLLELIIRRRLTTSWKEFFWTHEDASWHTFDTVVEHFQLFLKRIKIKSNLKLLTKIEKL